MFHIVIVLKYPCFSYTSVPVVLDQIGAVREHLLYLPGVPGPVPPTEGTII